MEVCGKTKTETKEDKIKQKAKQNEITKKINETRKVET